MDEVVQILFVVIAVGIAILAIQRLATNSNDALKTTADDQAISMLKDKCDYACSMGPFDSQIAVIEPSSGTLIYTKANKICYNFQNNVRCQLCSCNLTQRTVLNLTSRLARMTYESHRFKCTVARTQNISINCTG